MSKLCIVEARFYADISDMLFQGAHDYLSEKGHDYDRVAVPGALEIPPAIAILQSQNRYEGFLALGCVIRGETSHYDVVAAESARGLMNLAIHKHIPLGNGILTCDNREQARVRADPEQKNKGGAAARALDDLLMIARQSGSGHVS